MVWMGDQNTTESARAMPATFQTIVKSRITCGLDLDEVKADEAADPT